MKRVLKIECERAFTGSGFKLALLIGCALAVWHALESYPAAANHYLAFIEDLPYQKNGTITPASCMIIGSASIGSAIPRVRFFI